MGTVPSDAVLAEEKIETAISSAHSSLRFEIALEQKPVRSGYLLKRGFKNFASWKRRYVVLLRNGYFNYYNSKRKIKGSVNFSNAHQCITCSKDSKKFYVLTNKRTWEFKAENKNEAIEWVKLIQSIMNRNNTSNEDNEAVLIKPTLTQNIHSHSYRHQPKEFDSDDDQDDNQSLKSYKSSSYIAKHKKRRRSTHSTLNHNKNIHFESWKQSVIDSLRDIIITVRHRQNMKNYDPNNYNDGYDMITQILCNDEKLKTIFYRITNNGVHMSMKQYIASMSLIQKERSNLKHITSMATQLLDEEKEKQKHNDIDDAQSVISTLSYFDDNQSMISELSTINRSRHKTNRMKSRSFYHNRVTPMHSMHSFKVSLTGNSLFSHTGIDVFNNNDNDKDSDEELVLDELQLELSEMTEESAYDDDNDVNDVNDVYIVEDANIRVEIPVNPASEILGNFLAASCGLCVPSLDVISSVDSAETYRLLAQYTSNIDENGNAPTLLVYEELDGVSLSDLKKQLEVVQISLHYSENTTTNSSTTTQERIQKYFVATVRKTFFHSKYDFSHDGRCMIRDSGFVFAVDMFLFNVGRFPVLLPFEGKANGNNLFISTDTDGDSALYGLQNRFMGGHDIIEMPYYLVNGGNYDDKRKTLLLQKQQDYTQHYIGTLQKFLTVLSEYYQKVISPNANKININDPNTLIHGLPRSVSNSNRYAKISHNAIIDKCLRPMANYIYIHCGFELIIIDTMNTMSNPPNDEQNALQILEIYRNKLIDNMITLLAEGILIGISEISDQMNTKDIDTIIQDIRTLDENMVGIELISAQFLKLVLRLFHSTSVSFQLNIEDSSESEEDLDDQPLHQNPITPTSPFNMHDVETDFD